MSVQTMQALWLQLVADLADRGVVVDQVNTSRQGRGTLVFMASLDDTLLRCALFVEDSGVYGVYRGVSDVSRTILVNNRVLILDEAGKTSHYAPWLLEVADEIAELSHPP